MLDNGFETGVGVLSVVESVPSPIDEKIIGGIALGFTDLQPRMLQEVSQRLHNLFDLHGNDQTNEAGDCITYGIGLGDSEVYLLEEHLLEIAGSRNHGMKELSRDVIAGTTNSLWLGQTATRKFSLNRYTGPIVLSDGTLPEGSVYSLLSRPF